MELIETHKVASKTPPAGGSSAATEGDAVTTSITVNEEELQILRSAVVCKAGALARDADSYESDEACKADIARLMKFEKKLRTAQVRVIKKRT